METQILIPNGEIKHEPDYEADQAQDCIEDSTPLAQATDNKDMHVPRQEKVEQTGVCGEYKEIYSCVQGYLPNSKVEYLQVMPEVSYLGLDKQDNLLDGLSEYSKSNDNNSASRDDDTRVTDMSGVSNAESGMRKENTSDDYVSQQEIKADGKKVNNIGRPFPCDVCGVGFTWQSHLNRHKRTHTGEKPYKCDVCGVGFAQCEHLKDHKKMHTGEKPYKCDMCGVSFASCTSLKNHIRIHTGEKPYKCDVCGVEFIQNSNLTIHKRTHTREKPFKCDECDVAFAQRSNLTIHQKIHKGEKPYRCDVCNVEFARCEHLKNHKRTHTGERPYKCDVCGVGFTKASSLKKHTKSMHKTEALQM